MWFPCGFEYIAKNYYSVQWLEFVLFVREMSGKSQGIFFWQPRGNPVSLSHAHDKNEHKRTQYTVLQKELGT